MNEGIKPEKTSYGTDGNASNSVIMRHSLTGKLVKKHGKEVYYTLIPSDGNEVFEVFEVFVVVLSKNGEISFSRSEFSNDTEKMINNASDERQGAAFYSRIFSKVFYVILEMLQRPEININTLHFSSANKGVEGVYKMMVKSKVFKNELKKIGFIHITSNKDTKYKSTKGKHGTIHHVFHRNI